MKAEVTSPPPSRPSALPFPRSLAHLDGGLILALLSGAVAWLPLVIHAGFLSTRAGGDSPFLLVRLQQLVVALQDGVFPVRWMPDAAYGLGYPFFNYYAPLPYYLAAAFHFLGFGYIGALKLTQIVGFVLASAGAYWLATHLWGSRPAGLLASLAYTYAPFHLVNIYVRGDSLGEFYAFAFYPLVFLTLRHLRANPAWQTAVWLGVAYAGLILSHNISALIFSPFVGLWLIAESLRERAESSLSVRSYWLSAIGGLALGLALSAWYWLPALAEREAVQLQANLTGYFHYSGHFRGLELLQTGLLFDYTLGDGRTPFVLGLAQAVGIVLGLAGLVALQARQRRVSLEAVSLVLMLLVAITFITPLSAPLWAHIPLLPFVQFPWRFLSVVAFAGAMLTGGLVRIADCRLPIADWRKDDHNPQSAIRNPKSWLCWLIAGLTGLILLAAGMARLPAHFISLNDAEVTPENLALYEWFTGNIGSTIRAEYLPTAVNPRPYSSAVFLNDGVKPPPLPLDGAIAEAHLLRQSARGEMWLVEVISPQARLAFHTYAFLGWQATVDDHPVPSASVEVVPGLGYLALTLPAGRHQVALSLGRTPIRLAAEMVSVLALVIAALLLHPQWSQLTRWAGGTLVVLLVLAGLVRLGPVSPPVDPAFDALARGAAGEVVEERGERASASVDALARGATGEVAEKRGKRANASMVTMDFFRDPFPHTNPDGVVFAGGARLRSYSLSAEEVEPGQVLEVTLTWDPVLSLARGAAGEVAEERGERASASVEVSLTTPVDEIFDVGDALAVQTLPMGPTTVYRLTIPQDAPRGVYLPRVELVSDDDASDDASARGMSWTPHQGRGERADASEEGLRVVYLRPVRVRRPATPAGIAPAIARFGDRIALVRVETRRESRRTLEVNLTWQALDRIPGNYVTSLRLLDSAGKQVAQRDAQPRYGFSPTSGWEPGEVIADRRWLRVPTDLPAGDYTLEVVVYLPGLEPTGTARLPATVQ